MADDGNARSRYEVAMSATTTYSGSKTESDERRADGLGFGHQVGIALGRIPLVLRAAVRDEFRR